MTWWYYLVGMAFVFAGAYKLFTTGYTAGVIWIVIGILFGVLARMKK